LKGPNLIFASSLPPTLLPTSHSLNLAMAESRTSNASWPQSGVPEATKKLIETFFGLLDTHSEEAGETIATKIFTPTGKVLIGNDIYTGPNEIREFRRKAWDIVKSRRHEVAKVYDSTIDASDLLFLGSAELNLKNGKTVKGDLIGRLVFEGSQTSDVKISLFQVWGDSGPLIRALQE